MKNNILDILQLALPAMISTIAGLVAMLVCTRILGECDKSNYYLLATFLPINYVMFALYESVRAASLTLSSHSFYQNKLEDISTHLITLSCTSMFVFIVFLCVFMCSGEWIAKAMGILPLQGKIFFKFSVLMIMSGGLVCIGYLCSSTFFALKKPIVGMGISLFASMLTCSLTYLFSTTLKLSWIGYAISIGLSYALSIVLALFCLYQQGVPLLIVKINKKIFLPHFYRIFKISAPVLLGYLFIFSSLFFINATLSHFNVAVLTGFSIAYRIQNIAILPAVTIGTAIAILSSKARIIKQSDEEQTIQLTGLLFCLSLYFIIALGVYFFRYGLMSLVTKDLAFIKSGAIYLQYLALTYLLMGPNLAYLTALEQSGFGFKSFLINIIYFLLSIGIGSTAALHYHQVTYLYLTMGLINVFIFFYLIFTFAGKIKPYFLNKFKLRRPSYV